MIVERTRTPLSSEKMAELVYSLPESQVNQNGKAWLTALLWLENGKGQSVYNNNFGNVSASSSYQKTNAYYLPQWLDENYQPKSAAEAERLAKLRSTRAQHPQGFRAYETPEQGFADWWRVLNLPWNRRIIAAGNADSPKAFQRAVSQPSKDHDGKAYCTSGCSSPAALKTYTRLAAEAKSLFSVPMQIASNSTGSIFPIVFGAAAFGLIFALRGRR